MSPSHLISSKEENLHLILLCSWLGLETVSVPYRAHPSLHRVLENLHVGFAGQGYSPPISSAEKQNRKYTTGSRMAARLGGQLGRKRRQGGGVSIWGKRELPWRDDLPPTPHI